MKPVDQLLTEWMRESFRKTFPSSVDYFSDILVVPCGLPEHGDYQCNAAMALAKPLKQAPRDIAQSVVDKAVPHESIARMEKAGPGFINLFLSREWLEHCLDIMANDSRLGVPEIGEGRTVVIDYSSPNVAKPMHIGHIRSTVIGNALDQIFRFLGYRVIADNHLGDWGTQFGILIMGYRHFLNEQALEISPTEELERVYVLSYEKSRESEEWLNQCRQELVKLQRGDSENKAIWKHVADLSLSEFERIYQRLGVSFDLVRGESFYNDQLPSVLERLERRNILKESEGAQVVFLEDEKLPVCIVRKSDGAFNYATTDLATLFSRIQEFNPETIIYVTDERQQLHFRQIFAIGRRVGVRINLEHVWFGLMRLPEGTFSTREGNVIKLEQLLDQAETRALAIVRETSPDMALEQQKKVAQAVGVGAVKYVDLSQNRQSLVTFTWDKALTLNGNSAPYLQYAHARIRSVQDKYQKQFPGKDLDSFPILLGEPVERTLAVHIIRFAEAVVLSARTFKPSVLADYLYELSGIYNSFYQNVPFLKASEGVRESRVRLCGIVAGILRNGLNLLGIETPDRI